jgi:signal peptidase I
LKRGLLSRRVLSGLVVLGLLILYVVLVIHSGSALPLRPIRGDSMLPTLRQGDLVLLRKVPFDQVEVGEIVAFKTPKAYAVGDVPGMFLHRVVRKELRDGALVLITKGDNSDQDPFPVSQGQFMGVLSLRIPYVGLPVIWAKSKQGIMFLSVATLLALLYVPAMAIFYTTVIKGTSQTSSGDPSSAGAASLPEHQAHAIEGLAQEQARIHESLLQLRRSIEHYALHLRSHTAVVEHLESTSEQLKRVGSDLAQAVRALRSPREQGDRGRSASVSVDGEAD